MFDCSRFKVDVLDSFLVTFLILGLALQSQFKK